jgi:hypothetical protein
VSGLDAALRSRYDAESTRLAGTKSERKEGRMTDRAALAFLTASGATAICILDDGTIKAGKVDRRAVMVFWLPEGQAIAVSRQARKEAVGAPDVETMSAALRQAAAECGVTLTPHDVAMERAKDAAARIESFMDSLKGTGRLKAFNTTYKAARAAAAARGEGFMSYTVALGRLRARIGARLAGGGNVYEPGLMAEVFR